MFSDTSNVVTLDGAQHGAQRLSFRRAVEEVRRDLQAEHDRHNARVKLLLDELAGAPAGAPTAERVMTKAQAAPYFGLSEYRLMKFVAQFHEDNPDRLPLAKRLNGKGSNWEIFVDRVAIARRGGIIPFR